MADELARLRAELAQERSQRQRLEAAQQHMEAEREKAQRNRDEVCPLPCRRMIRFLRGRRGGWQSLTGLLKLFAHGTADSSEARAWQPLFPALPPRSWCAACYWPRSGRRMR